MGITSILPMLPSGSGSPPSAEWPSCRLSPGAILGGRYSLLSVPLLAASMRSWGLTMSGSNASDLIGRSPDRRKLIAVVYADMVGYSRLIGLDDVGTLERLRSLRRYVIDPAIEEHCGRIVQTGGDSLLIVFDSIDGAVRCAVEVQQQVPDRDRDQPADRTIRFRVGINIGDAIADGTDLHGDAVNVAARVRLNVRRGHLRHASGARPCAWAA